MTRVDDTRTTIGRSPPGRLPGPLWLSSGIGVGVAVGASVVGFILDAYGPRVGYVFAAACGAASAASAATCLLGLPGLRSRGSRPEGWCLVLP
jgi:hypothetical protein